MLKFAQGQSQRVEDARFVTGRGQYTDDLQLPGMAYGVTVRSPYGHARITGIDTSAALAVPGVLAVLTHADIAHLGLMPTLVPLSKVATPRPVLAGEVVRFVGDPVAFVVAETRAAAREAAELVAVDYEELPAVGTLEDALAPGAPAVWPEAPGNVLFDFPLGDAAATEAALAASAHVTRLRVVQNRVAPTSLEVRAALGHVDPEHGMTLYAGTQGVAEARGVLARILDRPAEEIRLVTKDVGGGFGMKMFTYPEYALVLVAAERLGRPVKWTGGRSDAFQTDTHGRDMVSEAALGFDAQGRITALKVETWSNLGAYQSEFGPAVQPLAGGRIMGGVYRIPAIHNLIHGVVTNTAPVDAYRGAGRPEATYLIERVIEAAARELGLGVDELRRRNLLTPAQLPHDNGLGLTFDVGDFPGLLERAMAEADWAGFAQRKAAAAARGLRYGRGMGFYVEIAGGGSTEEFSDWRVAADGRIEVAVGTQSTGQGHETAFARLAASELGIAPERVRVVSGDTARLEVGHGTGGSRSLYWGGSAVHQGAAELVARGKALAAADLGVAPDAVDYAAGLFTARGTNATRSLAELAAAHPGALDGRTRFAPQTPRPTYPNGCHIAEVALDPDTGRFSVERYTVVDDFGNLLNPELVVGQIHGGVAQGLGQVAMENVVYGEGAQLITGSLMDYGVPRADDMPAEIRFDSRPVPSPVNPMGVKGCGEAGTIGALPSIMNALIDALDGTQIEMPATPEKLWRAARALAPAKAA